MVPQYNAKNTGCHLDDNTRRSQYPAHVWSIIPHPSPPTRASNPPAMRLLLQPQQQGARRPSPLCQTQTIQTRARTPSNAIGPCVRDLRCTIHGESGIRRTSRVGRVCAFWALRCPFSESEKRLRVGMDLCSFSPPSQRNVDLNLAEWRAEVTRWACCGFESRHCVVGAIFLYLFSQNFEVLIQFVTRYLCPVIGPFDLFVGDERFKDAIAQGIAEQGAVLGAFNGL